MADAEDDYFIPLQDQRVFGAGIKRKRIAFVPASSSDPSASSASLKPSVGARYLSIVLPKTAEEPGQPEESCTARCATCNLHIDSTIDRVAKDAHEASLAHQVCLEHSHPPSHLDRDHVGLKYLSAYGWDPDGRKGLGPREEGIRVPVKAKEKLDTAGLREKNEDEGRNTKKLKAKKDEKVVRLNAKQVRIKDREAKERAEKLRQLFYGPDLEKYIGPAS